MQRRRAGFTLVEILVVVVLIGLALSLVGSGLARSVGSAKVRGAAQDLAAGLKYTRGVAIVKQKPALFMVDVNQRSWQAPGRPVQVLPDGLDIKLLTAEQELVEPGRGGVRFYPDGASTGGRVTLIHKEREWRINIAWLTGEIAVTRPQ